ncbi:MAG: chloride channel protein [Acidimicrobiales bacterium]
MLRYTIAMRRIPPSIPTGAVEVSLGTTRRRMPVLAGYGIVLGGVGGGAAYLVVKLVGLLSNLALLGRVSFTLPSLAHYHPGPLLIVIGVAGALAVALLALWSPVIKGHGIPESLEAILTRDSIIKARTLLAKPFSAAIAMGTGGPFGAEGPIIVTGGTIGSLLGQAFPVSPAERRILLATGAAAGMAGVFATPIAAVVLAFELLLFERSLRALVPLAFSTSIATEIHFLTLGSHPLFEVHVPLIDHAVVLPLFGLLGVLCGLLAIVIDKGLFLIEAGFRALPVPEFFHPLIGALGFTLIGLVVPGVLSVGYWAISGAVNGDLMLATAGAIFLGKLLAWWIALASNTSGGTLAPIFLIGAAMGEVLGIAMAHLFPSLGVQPAAFALVAMGATFGAAARAPLTGAIFAIEVTGAYSLVVPMLIAVGIAELVGEWGLTERIMTDKLARRGLSVNFDTEADPLRMAVVAQVMDPLPDHATTVSEPTIPSTATLRVALHRFLDDPTCKALLVQEETTERRALCGVLSREALMRILRDHLDAESIQSPTLFRAGGTRPSPRSQKEVHESDGEVGHRVDGSPSWKRTQDHHQEASDQTHSTESPNTSPSDETSIHRQTGAPHHHIDSRVHDSTPNACIDEN